MSRMDEFEKRVEKLINELSLENNSNTPDFILARYLRECLEQFDETSRAREDWYGKKYKPASVLAEITNGNQGTTN